MSHPTRPYLFYSATRALCGTCLRVVDAKELIEDGRVYLWKRCPAHGVERVLLADDAAYWRRARELYLKAPEQVAKYDTPFQHGCPYDCGICPDHEQHGCVSILEITDHCNLRCPTCYASSGPERTTHRSLETIERMLDRIVSNETEPDVVQVSGGEPTTHPDLFAVLDACRRRPIRHLMLNTNGLRIAREDGFAERLATYAPRFEVYLQLDSLREEPLRTLRGADLRSVHDRALERLDALGLSTTLVMTIQRGVNDDEVGDVLRYAMQHRCVRGVTLQPVQHAGRNERFAPETDRLTLTEVRRRILEQCDVFTPEDVIPVPCHPDCLAMAYAIRGTGELAGTVQPLTRFVPRELLLEGTRNSITVEDDPALRGAFAAHLTATFSTGHGPESAAASLRDLMCCLPRVEAIPSLGYDRVFRVVIMQFLDRHTIDLRSVRKSCVHIAHPDGKRVMPFDTYNVLYRDGLEAEVLGPLRGELPSRSELVSLRVR
ncbi:MAG: radical SAM protein [Sandaracinaceae bacterium]|nr:radical SAM protein [Sandaracinaceae bacterium]